MGELKSNSTRMVSAPVHQYRFLGYCRKSQEKTRTSQRWYPAQGWTREPLHTPTSMSPYTEIFLIAKAHKRSLRLIQVKRRPSRRNNADVIVLVKCSVHRD